MPSKRTSSTETQPDWTEVIAKALAYLAVNSEHLKTKKVSERGAFLLGLGLPYGDAAHLLGSTEASLRELLRVANKAGKTSKPGRTRSKGKGAARR
jgi:hypothetical protein